MFGVRYRIGSYHVEKEFEFVQRDPKNPKDFKNWTVKPGSYTVYGFGPSHVEIVKAAFIATRAVAGRSDISSEYGKDYRACNVNIGKEGNVYVPIGLKDENFTAYRAVMIRMVDIIAIDERKLEGIRERYRKHGWWEHPPLIGVPI